MSPSRWPGSCRTAASSSWKPGPFRRPRDGSWRAPPPRLPNVTLRRPTSDMRSVYVDTALLLAPSQWEEAFGRVILEAQLNGIPVVASRRGGIPEVLEDGGTLLAAPDPPGEWARAIEEILGDADAYWAMSRAAEANAARTDFLPAGITDRFLELAAAHAARVRS